MNKKLLTFLFIFLGIVVNIVIILILSAFVLIILGFISKFVPRDFMLFLIVSSLISVILTSFIIYHKVLSWLRLKYKLDEHIDPLFNKGKK